MGRVADAARILHRASALHHGAPPVDEVSELEMIASSLIGASKESLVIQLLRAHIHRCVAEETIGMLTAEVAWLRQRKETR